MSEASGIKEVGFAECKGGGQIVVDGDTAYVAHVEGPEATTILDVKDPKNPRIIKTLNTAHSGSHSHKVRVGNGLMLTNYEVDPQGGGPGEGFRGGLNIFDLSDPHNPEPLHFWDTAGSGIHRFTFDGRYAYISPTVEGYEGRICMILDMQDPKDPKEVGRWWMPGQWRAGGETSDLPDKHTMCHHPLRMGDRLYVSYWHAGWAILDISDMTKPTLISRMDTSPPFPCPCHSLLPIPFEIGGRKIMLVADEDVFKLDEDAPPAFLWVVDITDEAHPMPFANFQAEGAEKAQGSARIGCHQPVEHVRGTEIPTAWFARGLQVVDISDPFKPRAAATFIPDVPRGSDMVVSNDVFEDDRGLIYLLDRYVGLNILERG